MAILRCIASVAICLAIFQAHAVEPPVLSFADLLKHPIGPYGVEIASNAKTLQGQKVRLRGFMVKSETDLVGQFFMAALPVQMSEHADGLANDLPASAVLVKLDPSQASWVVPYKADPILLEGILQIGRQEDMQGNVSWFQLQLPIH